MVYAKFSIAHMFNINILAKVIIIIERLYYVCTHTCMFVLYNRVFGRSQRFSIIWNANFWYQCLCVQTQAYERLSFYLFTCKNLCTSGSTVWGACVLANICVRFRGVDFQNISKGCFFLNIHLQYMDSLSLSLISSIAIAHCVGECSFRFGW